MSFTIPEELKNVYFQLLKHGPLTLGELNFLMKKEADLKDKVNTLKKINLVKQFDSYDEIPVYMALPPFETIHTQLDSLIKDSKQKQADLNTQQKNIEKELNPTLAQLKAATDFSDMFQEIEEKKTHLTKEFQQNMKELIDKESDTQTEIFKEAYTVYDVDRAQSSKYVQYYRDNLNTELSNLISDVEEIVLALETISEQNKNNLKKSIQETIKSLDEGAKLVGKTINDQIRTFENQVVGAINSSITLSVDFINTASTNILADYSQFKKESGEWLDEIEDTQEKSIQKFLDTNKKEISTFITTLQDHIQDSLEHIVPTVEKIQTDARIWANTIYNSFSSEVTRFTTDFLSHLEKSKNSFFDKGASDSVPLMNYLGTFEKEIKSELKSFIETALKESNKDLSSLENVLKETKTSLEGVIEKEYALLTSERQNYKAIITELLDKTKSHVETDILTPFEQIIGSLDNSFKDFSIALKRRYDKFSVDTSNFLTSVNKKIVEELLHLQGSNIDLLTQQTEIKQTFEELIQGIVKAKDSLIAENLEKNSAYFENFLEQKNNEITQLNSQVQELNTFMNSREESLKQALQEEMINFLSSLKNELQIIRGKMATDFEEGYVNYQQSIAEIQETTDKSLMDQKELFMVSLDNISNSISSSIEKSINIFSQSLESVKKELTKEIQNQKEIMSGTFEQFNTDINELNLSVTKQYLDASIHNIKNVEDTYLTRFEGALNINKRKLLEQFKLNANQIETRTKSVFTNLHSFYETINESMVRIKTNLEQSMSTLSQNLTTGMTNLSESSLAQFNKFEDISKSLEQITQNSTLEIGNEGQQINEELTKITSKNQQSLDEQIEGFTSKFSKSLTDAKDEINSTLASSYDEMNSEYNQNLTESLSRNQQKINHANTNLNKTLETFQTKYSKIRNQLQENKVQLQEKYDSALEVFFQSLKKEIDNFNTQISLTFSNLETQLPESKDTFLSSFKAQLAKALDMDQILDGIQTQINAIKNQNLSTHARELNKIIDKIKSDFSAQMQALGKDFRQTSKLRLEEVETKISKDLEHLSDRLHTKETNDVSQLREIFNTINTSVFNDIVSDHIESGISPSREALIQDLDNFKSQGLAVLQTGRLTKHKPQSEELLNNLRTALINTYNLSISKVNSLQAKFTDFFNDFQQLFSSLVNTQLELILDREKNNLSKTSLSLKNSSETVVETIKDQLAKINSSLTEWDETLSSLETNTSNLFSSIQSILTVEEKVQASTIYRSRQIISSLDLMTYLENMMARTERTLNLIIPEPENLNLRPLLKMKKRVRIKVVINTINDQENSRLNWITELYKNKANCQIYNSNKIQKLVLCIRDNKEVLIASFVHETTTGFIISNQDFANYFNVVTNSIIAGAKSISRKTFS